MPDEEFSFRSLIPPGVGARQAIQRDIEERIKRERGEPGWLFPGPASYLKAHGQFFGGVELPDERDHLIGMPTRCHINALLATQQDRTLRYFTGLYTPGRQVTAHSWCVDPDGVLVEVTYPTKGVAGHRMIREDGLTQSDFTWLPPEHWSYFGLEFSASHVEALIEEYGLYLPILEPDSPYFDDLMSNVYSVNGWPFP